MDLSPETTVRYFAYLSATTGTLGLPSNGTSHRMAGALPDKEVIRSVSTTPASDRDAMIAGYIRHAELGPDDREYFWAWDAVTTTVNRANAEDGWSLVIDLLRAAPDSILGYIAAGPLEDVIRRHGNELIDWIEGEVRRDRRFAAALTRIWITEGDLAADVEERLVAASGGEIKPLPLDVDDMDLDHDA